VTDKGDTVDKSYFDALSVRPHLIAWGILFLSIVIGSLKLFIPNYFDAQLEPTILNIGWTVFNLVLLTAAICVARETANKRKTVRLYLETPVNIYQESGHCSRTLMRDLSMTGCRVDNFENGEINLSEDPISHIEIRTDKRTFCVPVERIIPSFGKDEFIHMRFLDVDIDSRREFVRLLFSRADTWVRPEYKQDNPFRSFITILGCIKDSLRGKRRQDNIHIAVVDINE
jgi:cellulose synthase (UDP-forming)